MQTVSLALFIISFILMILGDCYSYFGLFIFTLSLLLFMFSFFNPIISNEEVELALGEKVIVPQSVYEFERKNYLVIKAAFKNAGFKDIECVPLYDLSLAFLYKPGMVESITINGESLSLEKNKFKPNASVVISYHSHR